MKTKKKTAAVSFFFLTGIALLAAAAVLLISWQWGIRTWDEKTDAYVHTIRSIIPEPQGAALEERSDNTMSALALDGTDFVGILEMPIYDSVLPVSNSWGQSDRYPCRFSGSIYDGTMQIGATSQAGQYEFFREISVGDPIYFTDMEGNRYAYEVKNLRYEKHADEAALMREDAALTLFIKNVYAFEYIIVFCDTLR
jgi:hypothetical protein